MKFQEGEYDNANDRNIYTIDKFAEKDRAYLVESEGRQECLKK